MGAWLVQISSKVIPLLQHNIDNIAANAIRLFAPFADRDLRRDISDFTRVNGHVYRENQDWETTLLIFFRLFQGVCATLALYYNIDFTFCT